MGSIKDFKKVYDYLKENEPPYKAYIKTERRHINKYGCRRFHSFTEFQSTLKEQNKNLAH